MSTQPFDVLLIDDDFDLLCDLRAILSAYGLRAHGIQTVADVARIKCLLEQGEVSFRAILLDLMMPWPEGIAPEIVDFGRTTGLHIYREHIRPLLPHTPVIVVTAIVGEGTIRNVRAERNIVRVVHKPVSAHELVEAILALDDTGRANA